MATLGERLKQALHEQRMTQTELSEVTGISRPTISQYISDQYRPGKKNLQKMSQILGVEESWLLGYDTPKVWNDAVQDAGAEAMAAGEDMPFLEEPTQTQQDTIDPHETATTPHTAETAPDDAEMIRRIFELSPEQRSRVWQIVDNVLAFWGHE